MAAILMKLLKEQKKNRPQRKFNQFHSTSEATTSVQQVDIVPCLDSIKLSLWQRNKYC